MATRATNIEVETREREQNCSRCFFLALSKSLTIEISTSMYRCFKNIAPSTTADGPIRSVSNGTVRFYNKRVNDTDGYARSSSTRS